MTPLLPVLVRAARGFRFSPWCLLAALSASAQLHGQYGQYGQNYGQYGQGLPGFQQQQNPWGYGGSFSPAQGYGWRGFPSGYPGGPLGGYSGGMGPPGAMGGMGMGSPMQPMIGAAGQASNVLYPSWATPSPGFSGNSLFPGQPGAPPGGGLLGFPVGDRRGPDGLPPPGGLVGPVGPLPSWLSSAAATGGGERKEVASLRSDRFQTARLSERVEVRPAGEKAFFPLLFWKKLMELGGDSEVRLFGSEAHSLLTFADGTRLELVGTGMVRVTEINEDRLSLRVTALTTLRLSAGRRPTKTHLPEGTVVEAKGTEVSVHRDPDQDYLVVRNFGPAPATVVAALGEIHLEPNKRCWLPLVLNPHPRPVGEVAGGPGSEVRGAGNEAVRTSGEARILVEGRVLTVDGGTGQSAVRWGGASFRLSGGQRLILDPLLGERFPLGVEPIEPTPQSLPAKVPSR
jgi:hypothetical protein